MRLDALDEDDLARIVERALGDGERGLGGAGLAIGEEALDALVAGAHGDARAALSALEIAAEAAGEAGRARIDMGDVRRALQERRPYYDKEGDYHYDAISAFIKSVRGSDPDAAIYWLARMVEAGEEPLFVVRRMVILAAEDIGLADPQALGVATACQQAVHFIGMPEGFLPMAECALYLALAPKSNSALTAYVRASEDARRTSHLPVPLHLRNAPTGLMRELGYGAGYRYAHDEPDHYVRGERYLPEEMGEARYYHAGALGAEATLAERLAAQRPPEEDRPDASPD